MAKDIRILRFIGEELIAEVLSETETTIEVKNPLRIVIIPNKVNPQSPDVGFAPYCEWTDENTLTLSKNMLLCTANPIELFIKQYQQQFSGLVLPESKIIT